MGWIDIAVTVFYLVSIVTLGCLAGYITRRRGTGEARNYFLAGGTLRWPVIGMALFATNISCVHLVSLAQSGYDSGLLNGNFEWMAVLTLIMLGLFFAPFYIRSRVATLPDFLERRYCRACRDWLAILSMLSAITIHIGFSFLTGGIVLKTLFNVDMYTSIVVVAALTGLYTIVGGLMAVVVTEAIQTVVLIIGAALITWFAWDKMGGWDAMHSVLAVKNALGEDTLRKVSMLRPHGDIDGMPWYSVFLGYPVLGIWYWCAEQTIVQRVLGARSEDHARVGPLFASAIKILPVFIFVMPGLFAFTLAKSGKLDVSSLEMSETYDVSGPLQAGSLALDEAALVHAKAFNATTQTVNLSRAREAGLLDAQAIASIRAQGQHVSDEIRDVRVARRLGQLTLDDDKLTAAGVLSKQPTKETLNVTQARSLQLIDDTALQQVRTQGERVYDSKGIYSVMITQLMPTGLIGVMVAALLAALMSTVSGALNSISTLFSYDLYKRFRPDTSDHKLVFIGRVSAFIALLIAVGMVPLLNNYESIFNGLNEILAHMAPPVTCVFMLGVFWPRASAMSAKLTLWFGSALGAFVFLLGKIGDVTPASGWLAKVSGHSMFMMAFYLLCACITMQVVFSLIWPAGESERSSHLYWDHPLKPLADKGWPGLGNYKLLSVLLIIVMTVLYYLFR
jgi:SSS family transporter